MTVFWSFCYKETKHVLRDTKTLVLLVIVPAMLALLFGFAISTDVQNIDVAIVAPKLTSEVHEAVTKLNQNQYFTFQGLCTQPEAEGMLRSGKADAIVCFDHEDASRMHIMLDASNTNMSQSADIYIRGLLASDNTIMKQMKSIFEIQMLYNPQMRSAYNFVPGIMGLLFILICTLMTSVSIAREKENRTMAVLLVSPVRPLTIIVAKMFPYMVLSFINLIIILCITWFILELPMVGNVMAIIGVSTLYIILALFLGLLISVVSKTQVAALLQCALLILSPAILFSGMIYPLENLPLWLRPASWGMPATWYISALRKLMIEGLEFEYVQSEVIIMFLMTVLILGSALLLFKDKIE